MGLPETFLKTKIKESGLRVNDVANKLRIPYGTLSGYLNGICPMPVKVKERIHQIIDEQTKTAPVTVEVNHRYEKIAAA